MGRSIACVRRPRQRSEQQPGSGVSEGQDDLGWRVDVQHVLAHGDPRLRTALVACQQRPVLGADDGVARTVTCTTDIAGYNYNYTLQQRPIVYLGLTMVLQEPLPVQRTSLVIIIYPPATTSSLLGGR